MGHQKLSQPNPRATLGNNLGPQNLKSWPEPASTKRRDAVPSTSGAHKHLSHPPWGQFSNFEEERQARGPNTPNTRAIGGAPQFSGKAALLGAAQSQRRRPWKRAASLTRPRANDRTLGGAQHKRGLYAHTLSTGGATLIIPPQNAAERHNQTLGPPQETQYTPAVKLNPPLFGSGQLLAGTFFFGRKGKRESKALRKRGLLFP